LYVTTSKGLAKVDFEIGQVIILTDIGRGWKDGDARTSLFDNPDGIIALPDGSLLVADTYNHRIRLVDKTLTKVSTLAGTGEAGYLNGPCNLAKFNFPQKIALSP
jgi:hypothetical protein